MSPEPELLPNCSGNDMAMKPMLVSRSIKLLLNMGVILLALGGCRCDGVKSNSKASSNSPDTTPELTFDKEGLNALHRAILAKDHDKAKRLLAEGYSVTTRTSDDYRNYPIHIAVSENDLKMIDLLLQHGADLDAGSGDSRPALMIGMMNHDYGLLAYLLEKGASVNVRDTDSQTPLHYAALFSTREVAELFITNGADVNAQDGQGVTPMSMAILRQNEEVVSCLLSAGARTDIKDKKGYTQTTLAQNSDNEAVRRMVLAATKPAPQDPEENP